MPAFLSEQRLALTAIAAAAAVGVAAPIVSGGPSLYVVLEGAMVAMSLLPGAAAVAMGRLNVTRHLPFWLLYGEVVIYMYLAPAAYVAMGIPDRTAVAPIYLGLQLAILVLLLLPLVVLYCRWTARDAGGEPARWHFSRLAVIPFVPMCVVLPALYLFLLAKDGLLFRRLGFSTIAQSLVGLPRFDFLVIRGFEALSVPLLCLLVIAVRDARGWSRVWVWLSLLSVGSATLFDAALNSRLQWILALVLPLAVAISFRPSSSRRWPYLIATAFVLVSAVYGVRIVENLRAAYSTTAGVSVSAQTLNPTPAATADTPLAFRLNGLDLMARMTPAAMRQGFSWGKSWWPSIVVEIGQVVAPAVANRYKLALATEPKWYLMRDYRVATLPDYPSTALTDVYGNLSPIGLPLAAVIYAVLLTAMMRWIRRGPPVLLIIGLFLLADVAYFEGSFIGLALRWVHYAPAVVLLLALNPLRREPPHPVGLKDRTEPEVIKSPSPTISG
jgi:hypothetical protein